MVPEKEVFLLYRSQDSATIAEELSSKGRLQIEGNKLVATRGKINIPREFIRQQSDSEGSSYEPRSETRPSNRGRGHQAAQRGQRGYQSAGEFQAVRGSHQPQTSLLSNLACQESYERFVSSLDSEGQSMEFSNDSQNHRTTKRGQRVPSDGQGQVQRREINLMAYGMQMMQPYDRHSSYNHLINANHSSEEDMGSSLEGEDFYDDYDHEGFAFYKSFYMREMQTRRIQDWAVRPCDALYNFQLTQQCHEGSNLRFNRSKPRSSAARQPSRPSWQISPANY